MIALVVIGLVTIATAVVAISLRNLIHSALLLIGSWAGIGAFYLWAGAEFVAFAQVLVYVGAISMVVLFAVLLTRHSRSDLAVAPDSLARVLLALLVGGAVLGALLGAVLSTPWKTPAPEARSVTVNELGRQLMESHAASLLIIGVMLTVALLGAIVIASSDRQDGNKEGS